MPFRYFESFPAQYCKYWYSSLFSLNVDYSSRVSNFSEWYCHAFRYANCLPWYSLNHCLLYFSCHLIYFILNLVYLCIAPFKFVFLSIIYNMCILHNTSRYTFFIYSLTILYNIFWSYSFTSAKSFQILPTFLLPWCFVFLFLFQTNKCEKTENHICVGQQFQNMVFDISSATSLKKTNFSSCSSYQLQINSWINTGTFCPFLLLHDRL